MGFGGVVTDTNNHIAVEVAHGYGTSCLQRVPYGRTQITDMTVLTASPTFGCARHGMKAVQPLLPDEARELGSTLENGCLIPVDL
jgi:hypothetical protein